MTTGSARSALAEVLTLRLGADRREIPEVGVRRRATLSAAVRRWLGELWAGAGVDGDGVALACSGSLARQETGPCSDLDLIVLHDTGHSSGEVARIAERLWYPIWDSGISLDHSVRSVKQCRQVASADLNVAGALLDLAPIAGDADLVRRAAKQLGEDWRANARKRLPEIIQHVQARHERFGELAQMLEPDLKEAKGGLRDMSVLRTLTSSWLADRPHGAVDDAYVCLLDVRDALQSVTRRSRNVLAQNDQDEVAHRLGCVDADHLLSRIGTQSRRISAATDETLRRAGQSQRGRLSRRGPRRADLVPLGPGLYAHDGEVVLAAVRSSDGQDHRILPLRAAATASRTDLRLSPVTARKLAGFAAPPEPWPAAARRHFVTMLTGPGLLHTWTSLDLAGVIDLWLPEWAAIRDRPQRNPLHRHTVDRHSLEAVHEAVKLADKVDRADLLLVAALLHDLGKRHAAVDHCVEGARLIAPIATRMGWPPEDQSTLRTLVAHHLTVMTLATKHDPTASGTAQRLAAAVAGDAATLRLLAALTEADARSAGPRTWTAGRASLMRDLVARTLALISRGAGAA